MIKSFDLMYSVGSYLIRMKNLIFSDLVFYVKLLHIILSPLTSYTNIQKGCNNLFQNVASQYKFLLVHIHNYD